MALENIEKSKLCQGENDRGWRASLGFMCQVKSFDNLVDGSYGNGAFAPKYIKTGMNANLDAITEDFARAREETARAREKP